MPLTEIRNGQERTYSDDHMFCRAEWARICGMTDYAIKTAIESSGAATHRGESRGTPTLMTPVGEFPKIIDGLERKNRSINGQLSVDRSSGIVVETSLGLRLSFQTEI